MRIAASPPRHTGLLNLGGVARQSGLPPIPDEMRAIWANVPASQFTLRGDVGRTYRSSSKGRRLFCGECGSPLAFLPVDEDGLVSFAIPTLDEPAAIRPQVHMCHADRLEWFETADELPRFDGPTLPHPNRRT